MATEQELEKEAVGANQDEQDEEDLEKREQEKVSSVAPRKWLHPSNE